MRKIKRRKNRRKVRDEIEEYNKILIKRWFKIIKKNEKKIWYIG